MIHSSVTVYNEAVFQTIRRDFELETLAGDCRFTEGPVWNPKGWYLFSDIPVNVIYKIVPGGEKEVYLRNSGTDDPAHPDNNGEQPGSNGLAFDREGRLLICQHGGHGIARYDGSRLEPFITTYGDRPLNSPNDLVVHSNGSLYFSDPPYGLKEGKPNPSRFQPLAGVYCWKEGTLRLICDHYEYPNGVVLSPDNRTLYICSNKPFEARVSAYDVATHTFQKVFSEEASDGIEVDRRGHVWLCNKDGLIILDREGTRMALIGLPSIPANICWGGAAGNDLFITARENVFLIRDLQLP